MQSQCRTALKRKINSARVREAAAPAVQQGLTGTTQANHQHGLASEQAGVSNPPPHQSSDKLGSREARATSMLCQSSMRGEPNGTTHCKMPAWLEMTESGRLGSNHLSW